LGLRSACAADAAVLAALHAPCFPEDPWSTAAMATLLESPGMLGLIATDTDYPQGFILCRLAADEGEVLTLAVLPAARRQGIGALLLGGALAWVRRYRVATLFLEVAEDNEAAQALYQAAGFVAVGRRPRYYQRGTVSVAALVLALPVPDLGSDP
jgi:ribosomal-protein-alanine N-acetyltransferase